MNIWDLKDALLADQIEDDAWYSLDELGCARISGRRLKCPGFLPWTESHIHWRMKNPTEVARFHPDLYYWKVWQFDPDAPAYEIKSDFKGTREIAQELQLPTGKDISYRSRIFTDSSFRVVAKLPLDTPMQYTIEVLGVKTKPLSPHVAEVLGTPFPESLNYPQPPMYFQEIDSYITVIWRLRVFPSPIESFGFSPSTPLAPLHPGIFHFEHRWHPYEGVEETFKNIAEVRRDDHALFDCFKSGVFSLLRGQQRPRRPKNSGKFRTPESFFNIYHKILNQGGGKLPPLKELLKHFDCCANTYYKYAKRYGAFQNRRGKPPEFN